MNYTVKQEGRKRDNDFYFVYAAFRGDSDFLNVL